MMYHTALQTCITMLVVDKLFKTLCDLLYGYNVMLLHHTCIYYDIYTSTHHPPLQRKYSFSFHHQCDSDTPFGGSF